MTLSTYFVLGACEAPAATAELVYQECREMLGTPDHVEPRRDRSAYGPDDIERIDHPCGIGLPAWLLIRYRPTGTRVITEPAREGWMDDDDYEHEKDYVALQPMNNGFGCIQVNWDTAYGYRGPNGESCSTLHALYVAALGKWCDDRGILWKWKNEYTGEWFDRFDGLAEFGNSHDKPGGANDWFTGSVLPAIQAMGGVLE